MGSLVRVAAQVVAEERARWLAASEWSDIQSAHASALQPLWDYPDGARVTTLARHARITKQSMSTLVDELAKRGYVDRVSDPADARATLVRLTPRGRDFAKAIRVLARDLERDWAKRLGKERFEALKSSLLHLQESWLAEESL